MSLKQFLIRKLMLFFTLSTLIAVAMFVLGSALDPDTRFGYEGLLTPLFFAGCCVLPSLVTWSKRELRPREWIVREALQFLLTEAVILGLAFALPRIDTSRSAVVLGIAGSVLAIYVLVFLISWLANSSEARAADRELQHFRRLHGDES